MLKVSKGMLFSRSKSGLEEPIEQVWKLDWKVASCMHGDCYRSAKKDKKENGLLWVTLHALDNKKADDFIAHTKALAATRVVTPSMYGVDSLGRGYVFLSGLSGKSICYDQPSYDTLCQRFSACVLLVAEIHSQGYACGNLSDGSFVMSEDGSPLFIGCCGGYHLDQAEQVPIEARKFIPPGFEITAEPTPESDVYALSILGLSLFGAQFPPSGITPENISACLEKLSVDAPSWAMSLLAEVVREPSRDTFKNAGELMYAIQVRGQAANAQNDGKPNGDPNSQGDKGKAAPTMFSPIRPKQNDARQRVRLFALVGSLVTFIVFGLFTLLKGAESRSLVSLVGDIRQATLDKLKSDADLSAAKGVLSKSIQNLSEAEKYVQADDLPSRKDLLDRILEGARTSGSAGAAKFVEQALANNVALLSEQAKAGGVLLEFLNPTLSAADRRNTLLRYSGGQRELAALGAAAIVFDKPDEAPLYRDVLVEHLKVLAPQYLNQQSEAYAVQALAIATDLGNFFPQSTEAPTMQRVSDQELWWLLHVHTQKRSVKLPALARVAESRQLAAWPRSLYLRAMYQSSDDSGAPYDQLLLSAESGATTEAVKRFATWYSAASEWVLYGVLIESQNTSDKQLALDALLNKPHTNPVIPHLIDTIRAHDEAALINHASLIGAAGLGELVPSQTWFEYLKQLQGSELLSPVSAVVFAHGSAGLILGFINQYGGDLNPDLLLPLLSSRNPAIRKATIPLLKDLPLASSRAALENARSNERDAEVLEVYSRELPRS